MDALQDATVDRVAGVEGWAGARVGGVLRDCHVRRVLGSWLSFFQQLFDVSSQDVLKRLKLALVPFQGQEDAANDFRTRPDFYGPFWVATTAVLFLAVINVLVYRIYFFHSID
eukprot:Skav216918  [mRNA]  locus=scaffold1838:73699:89113:- [translate_table: standard]